jgi:O-antigen/teichoic acid export membrane protein
MSEKRRIARNAVWNIIGIVLQTAVAFLLAPFLIHRLGETTYGLWIVLGSLTSYFGLLDLGVRGTVGRYIAFHQARNNQSGINETLSSALAILCVVGALAFIGIMITQVFFFRLFEVPIWQQGEVRVALLLVGCQLGLAFVANAFDATLWGFQRFDILNVIDVPSAAARAVLTFWLISRGGSLIELAAVTLLVTVAAGVVKVLMSFRENPSLRLHIAHVKRPAIREIFGYGVWNCATTVTRLAQAQMTPLLIGSLLGVGLVTPYSIANRLTTLIAAVLAAATGVLTPLATALHAQQHRERQRSLFLVGGKFSLALTLFMVTPLVLLSKPLVTLWVGPSLLVAVPALVVLALGEVLPNSQSVTNGMILAKARHRMLAYLGVAELASTAVLTIVLLKLFGLIGACYALAISATLFRGVAQLIQGCRLGGVSVSQYVKEAILSPLACAAVPAVLLAALLIWEGTPVSWSQLIFFAGGYTAVYACACLFLVGIEQIRNCVREVVRGFGWKLIPSTVAPIINSGNPQVVEANWGRNAAETRDYERFSNHVAAPKSNSHERTFHL